MKRPWKWRRHVCCLQIEISSHLTTSRISRNTIPADDCSDLIVVFGGVTPSRYVSKLLPFQDNYCNSDRSMTFSIYIILDAARRECTLSTPSPQIHPIYSNSTL